MKKIEIKNLSKYYGSTKALDDVSIDLEPGKIYGLLGRNGAGKTTLLNLMTDKIFPTSGTVSIDEKNISGNDKVLGEKYYMMEKNHFPEYMKVSTGFKWGKEFYTNFDIDYAKQLSNKFGLSTNKKIHALSTGYCTIFKIIMALSSNAIFTIYDEPVLGLDANHRDLFYKELLANYSKKTNTVIISTHLIEEVSEVLEETIIIKEGKVILKKNVEELLTLAYTISGESSKVDEYIASKKHASIETMGRFKSATILEKIEERDHELISKLDLDTEKIELQKLFIALTNV